MRELFIKRIIDISLEGLKVGVGRTEKSALIEIFERRMVCVFYVA